MQYDEYGKQGNPAIVFLHGAGLTDTFANQYCFSDCYHLYVPHLPGAGRAVDTPYDPGATVDALADWIASLGEGPVAFVGHSVGAELAVALASRYASLVSQAVFLSPWVCPTQKTMNRYAALASLSCKMLGWSWLVRLNGRYWGLNPRQTAFLAEYSRRIPVDTYRNFYLKRILLSEETAYPSIEIPMLAVCGSRETSETKESVRQLGLLNPHCQAMELKGGDHDFVQRRAKALNPLLLQFLQSPEKRVAASA